MTSALLPAGTPVVIQFDLTLSGSTTIVDTNPSASVSAGLIANHNGLDLILSLAATPGTTSGQVNAAVGDSLNVAGRLGVYLYAYGLMGFGPNYGSVAADVTARVDVTPLTAGVTIRRSSTPAATAAPSAASRAPQFEPSRPNPFNPATTLALIVPASSQVDVAVFDVRGRRVRTLHQGRLDAGRHEFVWNGRDDRGRALASGSYLARAITGEGTSDTERLLLLN